MACVLVSSCLGAAEVQPPVGAALPLEQFTRYDEFGGIKISPDGEVLAATAGKYGRGSLVFIGVKDRQFVTGIQVPRGFEIFDFEWVSATRVIYFIAERRSGRVRPSPTGEIFAVDRDGRNSVQIYGYRAGEATLGTRLNKRESSYATAELISTLEHDDRHILIAEYPWMGPDDGKYRNRQAKPMITRLDVYSGRKKELGIVPLQGAEVLVDLQDQVRFAVGYDNDSRLAALWKPQAEAAWQSFELPGFRTGTVFPQSLTADNTAALVTGVQEGESLEALYRVDLQSRQVTKLYQHTEVDLSWLVTNLSDGAVVGVGVDAGKPEHHWLIDDEPTVLAYKMLERAFPGQSVEIGSKTQDGNLALVFVSSDVNPGEYYLFDMKTNKAEFLLASRSWIDPRMMRPKEIVSIKARDGLVLHGYLTRPSATGPHPLVVLPHEGPHGVRDDWSFDWEVQLLASRGYAVLQVNFRGSGGYGVDFESAGHRQWGEKMQDDLTDATRWAIESDVAQSDRVCIFGANYGGYAALMGAVREPKLYRCAIGYVGVYDLELMVTASNIADSDVTRGYLNEALGSDQADLRERSPVHNASRIEIPILLVHGKEDVRADYQHAKRMKAALEANKKPLEWMALSGEGHVNNYQGTLPGEGHGIYDEETRREVYEKLLAFLERNLRMSASRDQRAKL
jgi:dipeptidyl aminopeptidase/acylaminoacyl peptidase